MILKRPAPLPAGSSLILPHKVFVRRSVGETPGGYPPFRCENLLGFPPNEPLASYNQKLWMAELG
jgi:hypothetical protein